MKKQYNLEQFKIDHGYKEPIIGRNYELYKSYFPNLDKDLYIKLDKNGMLGRLFRGENIKLYRQDIFIPFSIWRNSIFKKTNQYVTCVYRSKNPYWTDIIPPE